jgi:cell division protein FtsL
MSGTVPAGHIAWILLACTVLTAVLAVATRRQLTRAEKRACHDIDRHANRDGP